MKIVYSKPPKLTRRYLKDSQWVSDHIQELMEKYPDEWILVHNGKIIAHHEELDPVWEKANEMGLEQPYFRLVEGGVRVY